MSGLRREYSYPDELLVTPCRSEVPMGKCFAVWKLSDGWPDGCVELMAAKGVETPKTGNE